jgi:hypothetical protein
VRSRLGACEHCQTKRRGAQSAHRIWRARPRIGAGQPFGSFAQLEYIDTSCCALAAVAAAASLRATSRCCLIEASRFSKLDKLQVRLMITRCALWRLTLWLLSTLAPLALGCKLPGHFATWRAEGVLLPGACDHAPDENNIRAALFKTPPVEWNRLPHFQVGLFGHRSMTRAKPNSRLT